MKIIPTKLNDCLLIEPQVFEDERGFFLETFQQKHYAEMGLSQNFVQDCHSRSRQGVLRGLHFQPNKPQGKLVRVVQGEILDIALDLRPDSPTFGQWQSFILSADNKHQLWLPERFAHGFVVLSPFADVEYKCTHYYEPSDQGGIIWNDPDLAIDWQIEQPVLSAKDQQLPRFNSLKWTDSAP